MDVELVTLPGCGFCNQAKDWLRRERVAFREVPHEQHPNLTNFPTMIVDGRKALVGFDRAKWSKALDDARSLPSGLASAPTRRAPSAALEIEHTGGGCGKRVTPTNVGTMLGVAAIGGVVGTEKTLPWMAGAGAVVYYLGAKWYGCQVRAAGTGLMLGAVAAAVKHCVQEDRKDEAARAAAAAAAPASGPADPSSPR